MHEGRYFSTVGSENIIHGFMGVIEQAKRRGYTKADIIALGIVSSVMARHMTYKGFSEDAAASARSIHGSSAIIAGDDGNPEVFAKGDFLEVARIARKLQDEPQYRAEMEKAYEEMRG